MLTGAASKTDIVLASKQKKKTQQTLFFSNGKLKFHARALCVAKRQKRKKSVSNTRAVGAVASKSISAAGGSASYAADDDADDAADDVSSSSSSTPQQKRSGAKRKSKRKDTGVSHKKRKKTHERKKVKFHIPQKRVNAEQVPEMLMAEQNIVPSDATVAAETAGFNRSQTMNKQTYDAWKQAEMLYGDQNYLGMKHNIDDLRNELPRLSREAENKLLHECRRGEAVCEMGVHCESREMSQRKGITPPICLPQVKFDDGREGYSCCLMCLRNEACSSLISGRTNRQSIRKDVCIQSHANYVSVPNEYRKEDILPVRFNAWEGICLPIVGHRDSGYEAKAKTLPNGKTQRYWCQEKGYPRPNLGPCNALESSSSSSFLS